jgi:hypothetical protein
MQVREIAECDPKARYHYQIMKRFGASSDSITFEASKTKIKPHEIEKPTLDHCVCASHGIGAAYPTRS